MTTAWCSTLFKSKFLELTIIVLLLATAAAQCAQNSTSHFCEVNVTVTHLERCNVQFNETYVLRSLKGKDFVRTINPFVKEQMISSIYASFNSTSVTPKLEFDQSILLISIPTTNSKTPTTIKLSYLLLDGAAQVKSHCNEALPRNADILQWSVGLGKQVFDVLRVRFSSIKRNVTVIPGDFEVQESGNSTATIIARSVTGSFKSFAEIKNGIKCKALLSCSSADVLDWQLFVVIGVTYACFFLWCTIALRHFRRKESETYRRLRENPEFIHRSAVNTGDLTGVNS